MKTTVLFLISTLIAQLVCVKSKTCLESEITSTDKVVLAGEVLSLQSKDQNFTLTLAKASECTLKVSAYNKMEMVLTVKDYKLGSDPKCQNDFVKAGLTSQVNEFTACSAGSTPSSISAKDKELFLSFKVAAAPDAGPEAKYTVTLNFKSMQGSECGEAEITLNSENQTLKLPANTQTFNKYTDCDIKVTGINGRDFGTTIPEINFKEGTCDKDFVAVVTDPSAALKDTDKKCGKSPITTPIESKGGVVYLKIKTPEATNSKDVTFQFITAYPECGPSEIEMTGDTMDVSLPIAGQTFKANTKCFIRVFNKEGKNFTLTIPEINFAANECKDDYVSAATKRTDLPNVSYKKCGQSPVTDPFNSMNGEIFLEIKTSTVKTDTKVKLHFQSGASKPAQYMFMTIALFKILSAGLC